jgi:tetratricopeptide (TPR) repeat protein
LWEGLAPALKFKLITNIGVAYFQLQEEEKAAPLLIEAHLLNPESELGWSNIVNAYLAVGDTENAESYVKRFIQKFPDSRSAYVALIKLKAKDYTIEAIKKSIPEFFHGTPEVITALGLAARQRDEFDLSIDLLKKAKVLQPEDRYINQQLLQSWLESLARNYKLINLQVLSDGDKVQLEELLNILRKEQELTDEHETPLAKANLYLGEGFVLFLLKRRTESGIANLKGLEIDPESKFLRKQHGMLLAFSGDLEGAIEMLNKIDDYEDVPDVPLLLCEILRNAGRYEEAIKLIERERDRVTDLTFLEQSKFVLLDLYIRQNEGYKLDKLNDTFSKDKIMDLISLARVYRYKDEQKKVEKMLKDALKIAQLRPPSSREAFLLGEELIRVEMYKEAIIIFDKIADPKTPSEINQYLVRAYRKTGRVDNLLDLLRTLRRHNGPLKGYTELEVDVNLHELSAYQEARDIAKAYTEKYPGEFAMKLQLNGINIRLERYQEADAFFDEPIKIWELTHNWIKIYIQQLIQRNRRQQAFEIAYEYRRLKNNEEAHVLFLQTALQNPDSAEAKLKPDAIDKDTSVTLNDRSKKGYTLTIEDRPDNELGENEINLNHPKFLALKGKKVGDVIKFGNSFTKWEVTEIESKYTFAFKDSQDKCATIYSETSPLRVFSTDDFQEVMGQMIDPDWSRNFSLALDYYKACRVNLGSFAVNFGRHPITLWGQLRSISSVGVRVSDGQTGRIEANVKLLKQRLKNKTDKKKNPSVRICADLTALVTLFELPVKDVVTTVFGKLMITESTWDSLLQFRQEVLTFSAGPNEEIEALLEFVKSVSEIRQPQTLLRLNGLEKDRLDDLIGKPFHETLLLAAENKAILYAEDQALANLAKTEHKLDSTWSQALTQYLLEDAIIDPKRYEETVIRLCVMNYKHTYVRSLTIHEALYRFGSESAEVNAVLEFMHGDTTSLETAVFVIYGFITQLWRDSLSTDGLVAGEITYRTILHYLTGRTVIEALSLLKKLSALGHGALNNNFSRYLNHQVNKQIKVIRQNFQF